MCDFNNKLWLTVAIKFKFTYYVMAAWSLTTDTRTVSSLTLISGSDVDVEP